MAMLVRWVRGALSTGLTWAVLWMVVGVLLWAGFRVFQPGDIGPDEGLRVVLPILGLVGLLSGLGFAAVLTLTERRRSLRELSLGRVAFWGMLGSAAIPALLGAPAGEGWLTGILGASFASASVAIARRGSLRLQDPGDARPREIGASDGEANEVLA